MPTDTLEEYLEAIYKISLSGPVRPTAIAEAIGVSAPTVTVTLRRLASHGLVSRDGTNVLLTDQGLAQALDIVRRHRVSERFLVDILGLDWEVAHEEACRLEHALSPRVLAALERFLGDPVSCPHGHPIPSADGSIASSHGHSLAEAPVGSTKKVLRVAEDADVLRYLGDIGLRPGVIVKVTASEPNGGPLLLEIDGGIRALARDVASSVEVG